MRLPWLLLGLLLAPLALEPVQGQPLTERPWWERTLLDADRDGLDDALAPLLHGTAPITVLVAYARDTRDADVAALQAAGAVVSTRYENFPLIAARVPPPLAPRLLDLPGVVFVEADDVLVPLLQQSVPLIGAPTVWEDYGARGAGVTIAVIDDGAFDQHPDLQPKVVAAYDASVTGPRLGDAGAVDVVAPASEKGHGTHVAGTIVGGGERSGGTYRGVAPEARYVNVKVFQGPNQTNSEIVLRGLDWTLSQKDTHGIRVASLSLGGRASDGTDAISRGVDIAVDKGLIIVAAAGNTGPREGTITSPGAAEKAITVGAVDKQKRIAPFSSRGPTLDGRTKPDLVAPGVGITSTIPPASTTTAEGFLGGGREAFYGALSGTSMATPHVAGTVALMLEVNPELRPIDVKRMLLATAQDVGAPGLDNDTGYGFVNAIAAVQVAEEPAILESAQFRERLATIPDPAPEGFLDRLTYAAQSRVRDGTLVYAVVALVSVAALVIVAGALRRR